MSDNPSAKLCQTAIKILTQYERLAKKYEIKLSVARIKGLNQLRDNGQINSNHLPATLRTEFPGEFEGKTLNDIREICGM